MTWDCWSQFISACETVCMPSCLSTPRDFHMFAVSFPAHASAFYHHVWHSSSQGTPKNKTLHTRVPCYCHHIHTPSSTLKWTNPLGQPFSLFPQHFSSLWSLEFIHRMRHIHVCEVYICFISFIPIQLLFILIGFFNLLNFSDLKYMGKLSTIGIYVPFNCKII